MGKWGRQGQEGLNRGPNELSGDKSETKLHRWRHRAVSEAEEPNATEEVWVHPVRLWSVKGQRENHLCTFLTKKEIQLY